MTRTHGKYSSYTQGCRCGMCRAAATEYHRQRRAVAAQIARKVAPSHMPHEGPTGWMDGAACRNADTRQFFPARGSGNHTDWSIAASICATCNVSAECLA
jgi:hypothetical protein